MKIYKSNTRLTALLSKYLSFHYSQNDLSEGTKLNYQGRFNNIVCFLADCKLINIKIKDIDIHFIEDFQEWSLEKHDRTHISRNIELIKNTIDYAVAKGLTPYNKIAMVETKRSKVKQIISISDKGLDKIFNYKSDAIQKQLVAHYFILQADTGMSMGDLWAFNVVEKDVNGKKYYWLYNQRNKTKKDYWVPLTERALNIITIYNGTLTKIHRSVYNKYIKVICRDIGMSNASQITTHVARKSFATRMFEQGWTPPAIALMMGISLNVLFMYYIKKSPNLIENELLKREVEMA